MFSLSHQSYAGNGLGTARGEFPQRTPPVQHQQRFSPGNAVQAAQTTAQVHTEHTNAVLIGMAVRILNNDLFDTCFLMLMMIFDEQNTTLGHLPDTLVDT